VLNAVLGYLVHVPSLVTRLARLAKTNVLLPVIAHSRRRIFTVISSKPFSEWLRQWVPRIGLWALGSLGKPRSD
jgi:hypothetical protein